MEFYNSILLWTSIAGLFPIVIHLLNKEKPQTVNIPTVKFIIKAIEKSSGQKKVNNLLLLLVRVLILLTLTILISKPFFPESNISETTGRHAVIIIDNSIYTSHATSEGTQLSSIKKAALKVLAKLPSNSHISISTIEESSPFTNIKDYVREKIATLDSTNQYIDIHSKVYQAESLLKTQKKLGEIYIISDMNKGAWSNNFSLKLKDKHQLSVIKIPQRNGNTFITNINILHSDKTTDGKLFANRKIYFSLNVQGDRQLKGVKALLKIENQIVDQKTIQEGKTSSDLTFEHSFSKPGTYRGEITIDTDDAVPSDNTYYMTIKVSPPEKIIVLHSGNHTPLYLKAALAPTGWHGRQRFDLSLMLHQELSAKTCNSATAAIIICGTMNLNDEQWLLLREYNENDGCLIFYPDASTQPEDINQHLFPYFQTSTTLFKKELTLHTHTQSSTPFLNSPLKENLKNIRISQSFSLQKNNLSRNCQILLSYSDNQPCLVQNNKAFFFGLSPENKFNNFLESNTFAVLWHKLIDHSTMSEAIRYNFTCDQKIELPVLQSELQNYFISSPTGTIDRITPNNFLQTKDYYTCQYSATPVPGHYKCNSSLFEGFSCNLPRNPNFYLFPNDQEITPLQKLYNFEHEATTKKLTFLKAAPLKILALLLLFLLAFEVFLTSKKHHADI